MADIAPLNSAHAHARHAARETDSDWDEAAEAHRSAAADFSRAAKSAGDGEALRVLQLLEAQHEKLARIIKSQNTAQLQEAIAEASSIAPNTNKLPKDDAKATDATASTDETPSPKRTTTTSAITAARLNARQRESSPSLARDIASRRGIPPHGQTSPTSTRSRQLSPESQRRAKNTVAPQIPPSIMESSGSLPSKQPRSKAEDEGFNNFYNNLTTGTMSKLSSVLAYAGLPLASEEPQSAPAPQEKARKEKSNRTVSATADPDVKKYFSKAALTAIEDEHRQRGSHGQVFGPAESFYVVQKGGGTYSYADIARNQQLHSTAGKEEYVDAQEDGIGSPRQSRAAFGKSRTAEELELENTTLKTTLEQLASRLSNFEAHAQEASFAALTHSMASLHSAPQAYSTAPKPIVSSAQPSQELQEALERVQALESEMSSKAAQHEKLEALAQKQEKKIRMYHSKWEDVKKSAREKEKAKREKAAGADLEAGGS